MTDTESTSPPSAVDGGRRRTIGIAGRVFVVTAGIVCAVLVLALGVASRAGQRAAADAERRGLEQAADLTAQLLAGRLRSLAGGARVFVQGPYFRALVAERRRDDILDQAFEAAEQLEADWVFITDERGVLLAKSDEPGADGAPLGAIPLVAGALQGRTITGFGASRDSLLFQAVAVPIVVPGAAPVGVLVATRIVDRQLALDVRAATGTEVIFFVNDRDDASRVAATSFTERARAAALLAARAPAAAGQRVEGTPYSAQWASVATAGGELVGGYLVARPRDATVPQLAGMRRSLLVAGLLGVVLALAAAWSASRLVTRPTRALANAASLALDGRYDRATQVAASAMRGRAPGEIAMLGAAIAALLGELREKHTLGALLSRRRMVSEAADAVGAVPSLGRRSIAFSVSGRGVTRDGGARDGGAAMTARTALSLRPRPADALAPGAVIADRYEIGDVLGVGGTGVVYRAQDRTLGEPVALKTIRPELVADDPHAREELKHELRLTRRISHRNVVRTHDFGTSRGVPFITMELVDGASLAEILARRGALPRDVVLMLARQMLRALGAAHEQGIVHGDLKPANVLVAMDGLLKITDFGVAALVRRVTDTTDPPHLAGAVVGTPEYLAPERLLGAAPDVRADLYAAGMILHECLTGDTPFAPDTPRGFLAQKLDEPGDPAAGGPPTSPSADHAGIGARGSLEGIVALLTARDPDDRPATAVAVLALLSRLA